MTVVRLRSRIGCFLSSCCLGLGVGLVQPALAWWPEPVLKPDSQLPAETAPGVTAEDDSEQTVVETGRLDDSREWLSAYLNSVSGNIDSFLVDMFFADDLIGDDIAGSRAKITLASRNEAGGDAEYRFRVSVKLDLPNTNKRVKLLIESEEEEEAQSTLRQSVENTSYSAALRFLVNEKKSWRSDFDVGMRGGLPPDPFVRYRARRTSYFSEWELRLTQSFYYFNSLGWGEDTELRVDYPLNTEKLFRFDSRARYRLDNGYFDLTYGIALYHELSPKSVLVYNAGATGDSEQGASFYNYFAGIRYRRLVYSDWMYAELLPQFEWNRETGYETRPVLMLRLESMIFAD